MSNITVESIYRKFPFLNKYYPKKYVDEISVQRLDLEILDSMRISLDDRIFTQKDNFPRNPAKYEHHTLLVFDERGMLLHSAGYYAGWHFFKIFWKKPKVALWEDLKKVKCIADIHYVVLLMHKIETRTLSATARYYVRLELYKKPEHTSVPVLLEEKEKREAKSLEEILLAS